MTPVDRQHVAGWNSALATFERGHRALPGIADRKRRDCFVAQLVESDRRVRYVEALRGRRLSPLRKQPSSELFDPVAAAILHETDADSDEASWLVFLSVHFGKAAGSGWARVRDVYGALGGRPWTWQRLIADVRDFRTWLDSQQTALDQPGRRFGNHRKYQSLDAWAPAGTGAAVETYVRWVAPPRMHRTMFDAALAQRSGDRGLAFDDLYKSMDEVASFGRTGRFDYLTMIAKVGIAKIAPASTYLVGATGPRQGAKLLFGIGNTSTIHLATIDEWLLELARLLGVGMQVMEDALCNWQKSPDAFKRFRG